MRRRAVLVVSLLLLAGCGQAAAPSATPTSVKVGTGPVGVAADANGAVWVVGADGSSLTRVTTKGPAATASISAHTTKAIGSIPLRAAVGFDAVWVTSFGDGTLLKVDPTTSKVISTTAVGDGAEGVAVGLGSVWVVAQDAGQLLRIRPGDAKVVQRIDVGDGARLVATDNAHVWVSQFAEQRVLRVEPATGAVTRSDQVCAGAQGLAPGPDRLWVTCTSSNKVIALDLHSLKVLAEVPVPGQPDPVRLAPDGSVLVGVEDGPTLLVLDPADGHVLSRTRFAHAPPLNDRANIDLAVSGGRAWLSSHDEGLLYQVLLK